MKFVEWVNCVKQFYWSMQFSNMIGSVRRQSIRQTEWNRVTIFSVQFIFIIIRRHYKYTTSIFWYVHNKYIMYEDNVYLWFIFPLSVSLWFYKKSCACGCRVLASLFVLAILSFTYAIYNDFVLLFFFLN